MLESYQPKVYGNLSAKKRRLKMAHSKHETKKFSVSVPQELYDRLADLARRDNRPVSNLIATMCAAQIGRYKVNEGAALMAEETPAYETGSRTVPIAPAKDGHPKRRASAS
jgi:macrodomain Ter protein organizer (MatP/YcbG family)